MLIITYYYIIHVTVIIQDSVTQKVVLQHFLNSGILQTHGV